ncbi:MAG: hypothetical protein AAB263_16440, partial [Planctomycetota bacterium]
RSHRNELHRAHSVLFQGRPEIVNIPQSIKFSCGTEVAITELWIRDAKAYYSTCGYHPVLCKENVFSATTMSHRKMIDDFIRSHQGESQYLMFREPESPKSWEDLKWFVVLELYSTEPNNGAQDYMDSKAFIGWYQESTPLVDGLTGLSEFLAGKWVDFSFNYSH